jgi:hypothetical protein
VLESEPQTATKITRVKKMAGRHPSSTDSPDPASEFRKELRKVRDWNPDSSEYIPIDELDRLTSLEFIRELFSRDPVLCRKGYQFAYDVYEQAPKLLATYVWARLEGLGIFEKLWNCGIRDKDLPFDRHSPPECFSPRDPDFVDLTTSQWLMLAPVFGEDDVGREFQSKHVMPFRSKEKIGRGGYSEVFKIQLHEAHQKIPFLEKVAY